MTDPVTISLPYPLPQRALDTFRGRRDRRFGTVADPDRPATAWLRENRHAWSDRCATRFALARTRTDAALTRARAARNAARRLESQIAVSEAEVTVLRAAERTPAVRLGTERHLSDVQVAHRTADERRAVTAGAQRCIATLRQQLEDAVAEAGAAEAEVQREWAAAWWHAQRTAELHCRRSAVYSRAFLRGAVPGVDPNPLHREQGPVNSFPERCPWLLESVAAGDDSPPIRRKESR